MTTRCVQLLPAIIVAATWTSAGAQPAEVNIDVSKCITLESDVERYACFERLTATALAATPAGDSEEVTKPEGADHTATMPESRRTTVTRRGQRPLYPRKFEARLPRSTNGVQTIN
jgi:hypothetical protein